jgi:GH25 family lysozyme M1 (1,4-beta-N-acetylmuramidase)
VTRARGEDRSSYQKVAGWAGNKFGIAKATEGLSFIDPTFSTNWANLRAEGLPRAAYHFYHPALSAQAQASYFVDAVKSHGGIIPGDVFMADIELTAGEDGVEEAHSPLTPRRMHVPFLSRSRIHPAQRAQAGEESVGSGALAFMNYVNDLLPGSNRQILYTDTYMAENYLGSCSAYALMIAAYAASPPASVKPWGSWLIWQSQAGGGIGGGDNDWFYNDSPAAWFHQTPAPTPTDWTEAAVATLPTLKLGDSDKGGSPLLVHRVQIDVAGIGRWNSLGKVTAVTDDGEFGASTEAGVKAVQKFFGLTQDGVVGEDTWKKLLGVS